MDKICLLQNEVKELREELKSAIKFFNTPIEKPSVPQRKLTEKEKFAIELERRKSELEKQSIARIKKG